VNWIHLASDKGQWRAVVNVKINFQVLERRGLPEILKETCVARTVSRLLYRRNIGCVSGMKCLTFVCVLVQVSLHVSDNPLN
jgi:hypothetical protein